MAKPIKVRATKRGYYIQIRDAGDEFLVDDPALFSERWMEKIVQPKKPAPAKKTKAE